MQVQRIQNNNNYNTSFMAKNLTNKAAYERIKLLRRDLLSSIVNGKYDKFVKLRQEYVENRAKYPLEANSLRPLKNVLREDMDIKSAAKGLINMLKFAVKDLFRAHNAK